MKIFDVFRFGFELDLLEIRLNLLYPYVDYFVFSESKWALSGMEKGLYYKDNKERFKQFEDKIIYTEIPDPTEEQLAEGAKRYPIIEGHPTYQRDVYQKNSIMDVLDQHCSDDDIIIWSDLDEVPNPEAIKEWESFYSPENVYNFAQDNYQAALNYFETTGTITSETLDFDYGEEGPRWVGTKMFSFSKLKKYTLADMRRPLPEENNMRIYPGGWHWSTVGSAEEGTMEERVLMKIKTTPHRELDQSTIINSITQKISEGRSPIGQENAAYTTVEFNEDNFPEYLLNNREKYSYLIKDT